MDAAKGDNWLMRSLIILLLSISASAHGIKCNVTQSDGVTQYSVPEFKAINCQYSWTNVSGHVLANQIEGVDTLVLKNTDWSLRTNQCFRNISYVRSCTSEGIKMEAKCTTSCSINAENQDGKGTNHNHWIIPTSACIFVTLLVILLCYRKRQCLTPTIQNIRPNVADEEAQL